MHKEEQIIEDIIEIGRMLYEKGLLVGKDGNISIKTSDDMVYVTASGFCKGRLERKCISKVDMHGNLIRGLKPARDLRMHLAVYEERPEISAVVHAHPPVITGYAMSEVSYDRIALPEVLFTLKEIAVAEYSTPTTIEVPEEIRRVLRNKKDCRAIICSNHGALTMSDNVYDAFYQMETLEMYAKANLVSKVLGNTRYLNTEQLDKAVRLAAGENPDEIVPENIGT